jgi:hypothetical protein
MVTRILLSLLIMLQAAAPRGAAAADDVCGDVNASGTVTTIDALLVLKKAVEQPVELQCPVSGGLPQTGQITCYDAAGTPIACTGTGQDGEFQQGLARSFTDNGDGTITDNVTKLMWEKLSDDGSIHDWDNTYTWTAAVTGKMAALNAASFAGHNDWRLPNQFELYSLDNLGVEAPATYDAFNHACVLSCTVATCSCTQPSYYWSSTTQKHSPPRAWRVDFSGGGALSDAKLNSYYVRAVRAGP